MMNFLHTLAGVHSHIMKRVEHIQKVLLQMEHIQKVLLQMF